MNAKVLIVEDQKLYQDLFSDILGDDITILKAFTIEEAKEHFSENSDIDIIAMDACVPGDIPNTLILTSEIRKTFKGPIIAISSSYEYRTMLMKFGCDYQCKKEKLPKTIRQILV